ncbi:hypothetical protein CRUP_030615, partial [Coryphaenoides rupestris]
MSTFCGCSLYFLCGVQVVLFSVQVQDLLQTVHHVPQTLVPEPEGLELWSQQVERGTFLLDGRNISEDTELTAGHMVCAGEQSSAQLRPCGGRAVLRGAVHARAYLHGNKPRAKLAEKVLKRDLISTVAVRVQMILEELMAAEIQDIEGYFLVVALTCRVTRLVMSSPSLPHRKSLETDFCTANTSYTHKI